MENTNKPKMIDLKNSIVAFIDVMGFKEILNGPDRSVELEKYFSTVANLLTGNNELLKKSDFFKFDSILFSDAIVVSFPLTGDRQKDLELLSRLCMYVGFLQQTLAFDLNLWSRGAISIGEFYLSKAHNILVGNGYVSAYQLEHEADYPRVIIDPKILGYFELGSEKFINEINSYRELNVLVPFEIEYPVSQTGFVHDAIQIDWFKFSFILSSDFEKFFNNTKARSVLSMNIYRKYLKLISYLYESMLHCADEESRKNVFRDSSYIAGSYEKVEKLFLSLK